MKTLLIKLGGLLLQALPVEQILATCLNRCIDQISSGNMTTALKTVQHISELADLTLDILADKNVDEREAGLIVKELADLRVVLLEKWAEGKPSKDVQKEIAALSTTVPSYA